MPDPPRRVVSG